MPERGHVSRLLSNSDLRSTSTRKRRSPATDGARVVNGRAVLRFQINGLGHCFLIRSMLWKNSQGSFFTSITLVPPVIEVLCYLRCLAACEKCCPTRNLWIWLNVPRSSVCREGHGQNESCHLVQVTLSSKATQGTQHSKPLHSYDYCRNPSKRGNDTNWNQLYALNVAKGRSVKPSHYVYRRLGGEGPWRTKVNLRNSLSAIEWSYHPTVRRDVTSTNQTMLADFDHRKRTTELRLVPLQGTNHWKTIKRMIELECSQEKNMSETLKLDWIANNVTAIDHSQQQANGT